MIASLRFADRARVLPLSMVVALALVAACGDDDGPSDGDGGLVDRDALAGDCTADRECADDIFCDGVERCVASRCVAGAMPCLASQTCDETEARCVSDCTIATDADGDGSRAIDCGGDDCDDANDQRFPGNFERCDAVGLDEDCDATTLAGDEGDADDDGEVSSACCQASALGALTCGGDCDDTRAGISPGAIEVCNGIDDDCNGLLDHPAEDNDGDGHADVLCAGTLASDCDDTDPRVYFDAPEICDGRDDDCRIGGERTRVPGAQPGEDDDGDGHAALASSCLDAPGALPKDDCDDSRAATYPGAFESCNGIDDDCDGVVDELDGSTVAGTGCVPRAIAAGDAHTCAIRPDGRVVCWGGNTSGELGDTAAAADEAVLVGGVEGAREIDAGAGTTCARGADDVLTCWGWDGLLGPRTTLGFPAVAGGFGRLAGLGAVSDFSLGGQHACAVRGGRVVCWGASCQRVVDGTTSECAPSTSQGTTEIAGITDAVQVDAGTLMNCAARSSGRVTCWGPNYGGMLGGGTTAPGVVEVTGITDAVEVAIGYDFACARHASGAVSCWGGGDDGRLGCQGTTGCPASGALATAPVRVTGLTDAVHVGAGGGRHACALRATGTLVCWGDNTHGQIGDDSWAGPGTTSGADARAPVAVSELTDVVSFTVGVDHTCATRVDGTYCWGLGDSRQLGDGRTDHLASTPHPGYLRTTRPVRVSAIVAPLDVEAGHDESCFVRHDGAVLCAGTSTWGEIDPAGREYRGVPQRAFGRGDLVATHVSFGMGCRVARTGEMVCDTQYFGERTTMPDAISTTVGTDFGCALARDGTVSCFGRNGSGQLGADYAMSASSDLLSVVGLDDVVEIASGTFHACARTPDAVFCWGRGSEGQLGSARAARVPAPLPVEGLDGRPVDIDAHENTTCAVLADGRVFCWGEALGAWPGASSPEAIDGLAGHAEQVAVGGDHACVRTRDGRAHCFGSGANGRLGTGGTSSSAVAVPVPTLRNVVTIDCGRQHCCAVRASGQPVCWGAGGYWLANGATAEPIADQLVPRMALDIGR
ncbi:MopE-related protein [Sandaracinus amylolyticus]|uniref:BNR repeat domain protein n=1 Tax=Sandaracinus amylolyticus TaxID=927083 RepID=A0A0F6VZ16_9BACT|nr:MopE-related protein [Sandaracinus amylolyticus]AKF03255.1 BNR repeat domain protein [Sandaracinus amylolyticus]